MYVAFKIKPSNFVERIIKLFSNSNTVHCEIATEVYLDAFYGYTSMPFKGVTKHWVEYNEKEWKFVRIDPMIIDKTINDLVEFYKKTEGKKYDYLGCLGIVFGNKDDPNRYFCSEWCAEFLGFENPSKYSPKTLEEKLEALC